MVASGSQVEKGREPLDLAMDKKTKLENLVFNNYRLYR